MMRNSLVIFSCLVLSAQPAFAQPAWDRQTDELLESGLTGLKESYNQLADRNHFLTSGIETYRQNIQSLRKELETLRFQKAGLLARKADATQAKIKGDDAAVYQGEIIRLRQRLDSLAGKTPQNAFQQKKDQLTALLRESRSGLKKAQSELYTIENQSKEPTETITQLQERQLALKDRLLKAQMGPATAARRSAQHAQAEAYLARLTNEVARMRLYRQQLEAAFSYLGNRPLALPGTPGEYQLRRKLAVLKEENMRLKKSIVAFGQISTAEEFY